MPKAKKTPSGSWTILVLSHTEEIIVPETGEIIKKKKYKRFTCSDPSVVGRWTVEKMASDFMMGSPAARKRAWRRGETTLGEALEMYIADCEARHLSPTTIRDYKITREHGFRALMGMKLKEITEEVLQRAINIEAVRPTERSGRPLSAKRLKK